MGQIRQRKIYLGLTVVVVILGLLSRCTLIGLSSAWVQLYLGDVLWGMMVFLILGTILKSLKTVKLAISAVIFATLIEFSQLIQNSWLNALRRNKIGGLLLGRGFLWSDLFCYIIGISIAVIIEIVIINRKVNPHITK